MDVLILIFIGGPQESGEIWEFALRKTPMWRSREYTETTCINRPDIDDIQAHWPLSMSTSIGAGRRLGSMVQSRANRDLPTWDAGFRARGSASALENPTLVVSHRSPILSVELVYLETPSPSISSSSRDPFFFCPYYCLKQTRQMADLFLPFTPSPRSTLLAVIPSASSSAENSPPAALTRSSPSPRLRREQRKVLHPLADDSDDGYSPHPSIYEASPVASDDEGRDDKEPLCDSYDSGKQNPELMDLEQPGSPESTGRGRNFSRFSGLSMMETIAEQKSIASTRDEMLDGGAYSPLQQDEESEDDGDEQYYYDYASPTQPLHPVMSASAPNLGGPPYPSSSEHPTSAPSASMFFSQGLSSSPRQFAPHQPTFRPALSMNRSYGTLTSHPFHRAPVLTTVPDPYTENQRTPDSLESPIGRSRSGSIRDLGVWGRLCKGFCLVCCCVSIGDDDHYP
ncbi:hypothetical protein Q9L58_007340 [Maublancomyces gigas]|uniref:Uncharacterized protein n=1 Tax=Discina gigas TaxID=1032678 RepID=A0ABR3GD26_9PEZI